MGDWQIGALWCRHLSAPPAWPESLPVASPCHHRLLLLIAAGRNAFRALCSNQPIGNGPLTFITRQQITMSIAQLAAMQVMCSAAMGAHDRSISSVLIWNKMSCLMNGTATSVSSGVSQGGSLSTRGYSEALSTTLRRPTHVPSVFPRRSRTVLMESRLGQMAIMMRSSASSPGKLDFFFGAARSSMTAPNVS